MSSNWKNLYSTATSDHNNGNYKDSYNNYLKAVDALLYKLNHEVSFANRDTVKTKPNNTTQLFTQLKSCVQRLEDILQNKTLSSLQQSYTSDLATSIIEASPTPQHLPLIPFSPLTRQSMHHAHQLATANQKVSITKQKSSDNNNKDDLSTLRKLDEEIRHHRNKLDQVNNQIQSISEVSLNHWDATEVSKQLTIIESDLFKKVDFKKDSTLKDKGAQACMDFHRYLTNSFTHQLMIHSDMARSSVNPPRGTQQNIIVHAVKIALLLLNQRNFNSLAALIKALTSTEVQRLWPNARLPSRTIQHLKELSSLIKREGNDYIAYKDKLAQIMGNYRDVGEGMYVIPWMQPHYEEIKNITQSYTSGKSGDNTGFILSEPGQHKLASIFSLLEQCKSNVINTDEEEWRSNKINGTRKVSLSSSKVMTNEGTTNLPLDCLGSGNLDLHHWLVSRVYLTKQQLIDESMEIEPLGENEQPLCVENEYDEEESPDHNSVKRYYTGGNEGGGDNIEAGTSSNHEVTNGSRSQSNKSPFKLEQNNSLLSSKTFGLKSIPTHEPEDPKINVESIEEDLVGTNSNCTIESTSVTSFTSSSKAEAIPIPQPAGQKSYQSSMSPSKILNPNAMPFVPRSSASGPTSDTLSVSIRDLTEMGKNISNTNTNATDDDDDDNGFIYPIGTIGKENKSDEEGDDDENFVYKPQTPEITPSNDLKDNADDDSFHFVYSDDNKEEKPDAKKSQDDKDDNDDGEGSSFVYPGSDQTSSEYNNNKNINKNGINGVTTKADKPSDSITVKLSVLSGEA